MRILHILDHGLPLQSGYTFRTRAILKAQEARGWAVAAVTGARQGVTAAAVEQVDGLTFHRTAPPRRWPSPLREVAEIAAFARRIDAAVEAFRPDVLHAHSPVLDALAALQVARARRLPLVYEIRAFWEDAAVGNGTGREGSFRYRATRALETWAVGRADAVAVICDGLRDDLVARGVDAGKITVSPNGVDMTVFGEPARHDAALAAELGLADAEMVGFIGSFYDYEGLDDLIDAMPALVSRRPKARLLLVGGGPCEAALRARAAASPVAAHIRFAGRVPHAQVERYYSLVDILAYPRKAMRLTDLVTPLKPLEAMAQGKLVAASDVGGHRELIRDGETGTLFAPDSPPDIAAALAELFEHRADWDARRARARAFVEAERNWASNISRYLPVYQRLSHSRVAGQNMVTLSDSPRLTLPIALAGAGAAALLAMAFCLALPIWRLEWLALHSGLPTLLRAAAPPLGRTARLSFAVLGGAMAGVMGWAVLHLRFGGRTLRLRLPVLARRAKGAPSVRRADAHPDAPPRAPIRADREFWPVPEPEERPLPTDLATPLADYAERAIPTVPRAPVHRAPVRPPAPLAPGERIETFALQHDVPADHAHSIESLLARLETGAKIRGLARSG